MIRYRESFDYTIENGRWVWTRDFLLRRGFCCLAACQNCPWVVSMGKENIDHDPLCQSYEAPIDPIQ
jgi:hypothetical protein